LVQDEDCLDTWFSSWLWPIEVFKGITQPGNKEIKYYYPTNVLVTGQDIIFFWVARMVMAGMEYEKNIPFADVYFTGMVRDKQGRKMSKSLGNSPDLLDLIDKYGADATRFGIMIASPAGNDLLFDEGSLEQGRNFNNKMWNALKLLKMWEAKLDDGSHAPTAEESFAMDWFANRLNEAHAQIDALSVEFKLSEALKVIYGLIWDDCCSWYLEWIKPGFEQPMNAVVYKKTLQYFESLMQLLHPYMPFVTEEIYHLLQPQTIDLCVKQFSAPAAVDAAIVADAELLKKVITGLREARAKNQIKPKDTIELLIETGQVDNFERIKGILAKQVNAASVGFAQAAVASSIVVAIEKDKFYIVADLKVDAAAQRAKLQTDLDHQVGFLQTVIKKLTNEKFLANAKPEVLAIEQKKKADAEARIKALEESLAAL
jgi:valyl-tRNA synthetase